MNLDCNYIFLDLNYYQGKDYIGTGINSGLKRNRSGWWCNLSGDEKEENRPSDDEESRDEEVDEQELLDALMKKVESAGELEEEVESHFSTFSERVEGVMDSIDRIERIERSKMEKLLFNEDEVNEEITESDQKEKDPDLETLEDQMYLPAESPYEEVGEGGLHPDEEADLMDHYSGEAENILLNLKKLIEIKLEKGEMEAAMELVNMAKAMGSSSEVYKKGFASILTLLLLSIPKVSRAAFPIASTRCDTL